MILELKIFIKVFLGTEVLHGVSFSITSGKSTRIYRKKWCWQKPKP